MGGVGENCAIIVAASACLQPLPGRRIRAEIVFDPEEFILRDGKAIIKPIVH